ncbi:DUF3927 family protein [Klebsiella aerogenes]|uniref:DUF3927 family protein n=1 Tax=Klebsiella aerogenes TaxID=548 RepID=UPI001F2E57C3|nr:DUF3927 family protein [Klebsiella aerogenes]
MTKVRIAVIAILLFLVVAVDFTGRVMSVLADGVLVAGVIAVALPMFSHKGEP